MINLENLAASALGVFLIKEGWELIKGASKKNTEAMNQLTISLTKVEVKLEQLIKAIDELPKMRKDVDAAHEKIRSINDRLS